MLMCFDLISNSQRAGAFAIFKKTYIPHIEQSSNKSACWFFTEANNVPNLFLARKDLSETDTEFVSKESLYCLILLI